MYRLATAIEAARRASSLRLRQMLFGEESAGLEPAKDSTQHAQQVVNQVQQAMSADAAQALVRERFEASAERTHVEKLLMLAAHRHQNHGRGGAASSRHRTRLIAFVASAMAPSSAS